MPKITVSVFPETYQTIEKLAKERGQTIEAAAGDIIEAAAYKFPLTAEDFRAIAARPVQPDPIPGLKMTAWDFEKGIQNLPVDDLKALADTLHGYSSAAHRVLGAKYGKTKVVLTDHEGESFKVSMAGMKKQFGKPKAIAA